MINPPKCNGLGLGSCMIRYLLEATRVMRAGITGQPIVPGHGFTNPDVEVRYRVAT